MKKKISIPVTESFIDYKLEKVKRELDDNAKLYRDQILTKLDRVMGELETISEENILGPKQNRELRDDVESLKKRVKKLEQS